MPENETIEPTPTEPIPHDGMKSRRFLASSIAGLLIFIAATALLVVSGRFSATAFFSADYWVKALWVVCGILAFGWGLLTADKALEVLKLWKGSK